MYESLTSNPFFSGGLVLMIFGSCLAFCRSLPGQAWALVRRQFTVSVEIRNEDSIFEWVEKWLSKRGAMISTRDFVVDTNLVLSPAPGTHFMLYKGRPLRVTRTRREDSTGGASLSKVPEKFEIQFMFCRSLAPLHAMLEEVKQESKTDQDLVSIYLLSKHGGYESVTCRKRRADTVVLGAGIMEHVLATCRWFMENEAWYTVRGVPYRTGFLLEGPPGNGKTSLIKTVASELSLPIYIIQLSTVPDDSSLQTMMAAVENPAIVVIEDVDCCGPTRTKKTGGGLLGGVTLSGLLNAIDGLASGDGRLLFMTTNKTEKLDAALLRPGRVDHRVHIGNATTDQAKRLYERFFPGEGEGLAEFVEMTSAGTSMAALQGELLKKASTSR